ncbi:MAG: amino acid ABC transporter permease [Syntrophomonadaceae bacterium]|jgi:His/Glu/Gln/Arg/opine family amino acid ABC transporter permease subunit
MADLIQTVTDSVYLNLIYEDRYLFLIKGFGMTLYLTVMTFLLGTLIGALFCRLRFSKNPTISKTVTWLKTLFIRLPTLVLLIIFVYLLFADTTIDTVSLAILAFAIKTGSYISDIMSSAMETVDKGEIEAGRTLGMSRFMVFRLVTLPQAIKNALPVYKNQLIITLQETSLVGFLAVNDLTRASQIITSRTLDPYLSIIITAMAYLLIGAFSGMLFKLVDKEKHLRLGDFIRKQGEKV